MTSALSAACFRRGVSAWQCSKKSPFNPGAGTARSGQFIHIAPAHLSRGGWALLWFKSQMSEPIRTLQSMQSIQVQTTPAGQPLHILIDGRTWHVGAEPLRWYERRQWWVEDRRAPRGRGPKIDVEVWQVQARIGTNLQTPLTTFELALNRDAGQWSIKSQTFVAA